MGSRVPCPVKPRFLCFPRNSVSFPPCSSSVGALFKQTVLPRTGFVLKLGDEISHLYLKGVPLTTVKTVKAQWAVSSAGSEVRGKRPLAGLAPMSGEVGSSRVLIRGNLMANATSGHPRSHKDFQQNSASAKPRKCLLTCRPERIRLGGKWVCADRVF